MLFSLALLVVGSTVTFNAPYSNAVDFYLQINRPGLGSSSDGLDAHDITEFGMTRDAAQAYPEVAEMLWRAASGGVASPAPMTTNDVQKFLDWKRSLNTDARAQVNYTLTLRRAAEMAEEWSTTEDEAQANFVMRSPSDKDNATDCGDNNPNVVRCAPRLFND